MIVRKSFSQFVKEAITSSARASTSAPSTSAPRPDIITTPKPAPTSTTSTSTAPKSSPTLDDLRSAAAKATMAGPSREAQALMSPRAKAMLGQSKLDAGIQAQQGVEAMRSSMPSSSSTPLPAANAEWAKANPKLAAAYSERQRIRGTAQTDNPLMRDMRSSLSLTPSVQSKDVSTLGRGNQSLVQNPNAVKPLTPTTQTSPKPTAPPQPQSQSKPSSPSLNPQQQDLYKQAYQNRNNPFAKGRIKSEFSKLTPEQQAAFRQYAKDQGHDWGNLI